jgi:hypothetical protein
MSSLGIDFKILFNFLYAWWLPEDFRFITDQGPGFKFGSLISLANEMKTFT